MKYGTIPELEKKLAGEEELIDSKQKKKTGGSLISDTVSEDDIAEIVAKWTGIPMNNLLEDDMMKLLRLEDELDQRVVTNLFSFALSSNSTAFLTYFNSI